MSVYSCIIFLALSRKTAKSTSCPRATEISLNGTRWRDISRDSTPDQWKCDLRIHGASPFCSRKQIKNVHINEKMLRRNDYSHSLVSFSFAHMSNWKPIQLGAGGRANDARHQWFEESTSKWYNKTIFPFLCERVKAAMIMMMGRKKEMSVAGT